ncbi:hypothetical protein ACJX0J_025813 [Zea mays]
MQTKNFFDDTGPPAQKKILYTMEERICPTQTAFLPGRNIMEGSCLIEGHIEGSGIHLSVGGRLSLGIHVIFLRNTPKKYRLAKGNVATNLKEKILSFFSHMGDLFWEDKQWNSLVALRNWNGPKNCVFCYYNESIQHLSSLFMGGSFVIGSICERKQILAPRSMAYLLGHLQHEPLACYSKHKTHLRYNII